MTDVIVRPSLLQRQDVKVEAEGDIVAIHIGNSVLRMHYEAALLLSQWIRFRAKEAKRQAGDMSRHWSAIGQLTDAEKV